MRTSKLVSFLVFILLLASLPSFADIHEWYEGYKLEPYWAKSRDPLIIEYPNELILDLVKNWVVARGSYPISGLFSMSNREYIEKKAVENAIQNLIEESLFLRVDGGKRLSDFTENNIELKEKIREQIKTTVNHLHYRIFTMRGVLQVTSAVKYKGAGSILNVVYPYLIEAETSTLPPEALTSPYPTIESENIEIYGNYTGLIIDARGFKIEPAINPLILDEKGNQLLGGLATFDIKLLNKDGKVDYFSAPKLAQGDARTGKNPLYIKAIKADRNCYPIVSAADGYRILEEDKKTGFLNKLAVSIII